MTLKNHFLDHLDNQKIDLSLKNQKKSQKFSTTPNSEARKKIFFKKIEKQKISTLRSILGLFVCQKSTLLYIVEKNLSGQGKKF